MVELPYESEHCGRSLGSYFGGVFVLCELCFVQCDAMKSAVELWSSGAIRFTSFSRAA